MVWARGVEAHGRDFRKQRFCHVFLIRVLAGRKLLRHHRRCFALMIADHALTWVHQRTAQSPRADSALAGDTVVRKNQPSHAVCP